MNYSAGEYHRGEDHRIGIASFCSVLKRGMIRGYYEVRVKHLPNRPGELTYGFPDTRDCIGLNLRNVVLRKAMLSDGSRED